MCGRYTLKTKATDIARRFHFDLNPGLEDAFRPRYNISPGQGISAVIDDRDKDRRVPEILHWGLVPSWADDPAIARNLSNARLETVDAKPSFRDALRYRRCLIPADGFYEWKSTAGGGKAPHYFEVEDGALFGFAAIWEHWAHPDGSEILSCALLTTRPNALMAPIHDRMPVILPPELEAAWLDPRIINPAPLLPHLQPYPAEKMRARPVSPKVNNARLDDPSLLSDPPPPQEIDFFDKLL